MAASFAKPSRQDVLNPVYPHSYIPWRQPRDFSNGRRVHVFEPADDDLAVKRLEPLNQHRQAPQIHALLRGKLTPAFIRKSFEFFQTHKSGKDPPFTHDIGSGDMVSDAIDPGPQGTASIVSLESPP
jgi:hypothetical protein